MRSNVSAMTGLFVCGAGEHWRLALNPSGVKNTRLFNTGTHAWLLLQAAGSPHPSRSTSGAGAPGHSEGMGPDLAPALRGACGFRHANQSLWV